MKQLVLKKLVTKKGRKVTKERILGPFHDITVTTVEPDSAVVVHADHPNHCDPGISINCGTELIVKLPEDADEAFIEAVNEPGVRDRQTLKIIRPSAATLQWAQRQTTSDDPPTDD